MNSVGGDALFTGDEPTLLQARVLAPLPLPATGLLLISGLVGLLGVGRSGKFSRGAFGHGTSVKLGYL